MFFFKATKISLEVFAVTNQYLGKAMLHTTMLQVFFKGKQSCNPGKYEA